MVNLPLIAIATPFVAGLIVLMLPGKLGSSRYVPAGLCLAASLAVFVMTTLSFVRSPLSWLIGSGFVLRVDALSGFVGLFIGFFGVLIALYSIGFMKGRDSVRQYYAYMLWTLGGSIGAAYSNNLLLLLTFWGFLGFTLYMLIAGSGPKAAYAAKKTFIIIGGSDAAMLLGVVLLWLHMHLLDMNIMRIDLRLNPFMAVAFLCLALGAFAKAGAMPLHTWIPDSSEVAPMPVMAFLPASLDKLLGIYFLVRITWDMFIIGPGSTLSIFLMVIGAVTIIAAVMMALVQHNLKRLLAYHAVSQVGYMVLGIGTACPLGIAGGLFHMVNHALYKSSLFLAGGSIERQVGTTELDELGGLGRLMPITFVTSLIAALSISGVPPFNGFFSKWMVYQALIESGRAGARLWVLWLAVAMFGSALTLASFMKLIYAVFLAPRDKRVPYPASTAAPREVPASMWIPQVVLAALCVIFGVCAVQIPLRWFIVPSVKAGFSYPGIWNASLAAVLILAGLVIGFFVFALGRMPARRSSIFAGGEILDDNSGIKATTFYNAIKDLPLIGAIYRLADKKVFDIYDEGTKGTFACARVLQWLHNGVLPTYMIWCLLGTLFLFFMLMR